MTPGFYGPLQCPRGHGLWAFLEYREQSFYAYRIFCVACARYGPISALEAEALVAASSLERRVTPNKMFDPKYLYPFPAVYSGALFEP